MHPANSVHGHHWSLLPLVPLLLLAGCLQPTATDALASGDSPAQQVAAASQSFGMLLNASVDAALEQSTAGGTARGPTPVGQAPDLRVIPGTVVVDLATLSIAGKPVFAVGTASGTITLTLTGAAAASWPAGTSTLYDGSVSVALSDIALGNPNGDRVRISSGTFTYALQAVSTVVDANNWTLTADATAVIDPPMAAVLDRRGRTWSMTLGGSRSVHQVVTRQRMLAPDGSITADTRRDVRTISGATPGGSLTNDLTLAALGYSRWTITLGDVPVTWSRNAQTTTTRDLLSSTSQTVVDRDATFIATTINARTTTIGPFTARQVSSLLGATLDPNWL